MIKLIDLLKELMQPSPPDVLYHFTTPENFVKILNSDRLKSHPLEPRNRVSHGI